MIWDEAYKSDCKYDMILIADCLFFKDYHHALIHVLKELMHDKSVCLILAPQRGGTLKLFLERASGVFTHKFLDLNDEKFIKMGEQMKKHPTYNPDSHEQFLIQLEPAK